MSRRGGAEPAETPEQIVAAFRRKDPHVAVGLLEREGERDLGLPADRILQIGSITKVFTALLLAVEVVAGRLRLDGRVADVLPADVRFGVPDVTWEELATHTSGLPRLHVGLVRAMLVRDPDPYAHVAASDLYAALPRARASRRGRTAYSNLGFGLLGHALSRHAGASYAALVADRITGPLGMADTGVKPADPARVLPGHHRGGAAYDAAWTFDAMAGAGALWSTVEDVRVFLAAHREAAAGAVGPLAAAMRLALEPRVGEGRVRQGLGWQCLVGPGGERLSWHNGGTAGYRSFVSLDRDSGTGVVVLGASDRSVDALGLRLQRSLAVSW